MITKLIKKLELKITKKIGKKKGEEKNTIQFWLLLGRSYELSAGKDDVVVHFRRK